MTKKEKRIYSETTIAAVVLAFTILIAAAYFHSSSLFKPRELTAAEKAAIHAASIEGRFETALNDFLDIVDRRVTDYKEKRSIIHELVKPMNMGSPEYVEENYTIAQEMVPEMNADIEALLAEFNTAQERILILLKDDAITEESIILTKWNEVKQTQIKTYTDFFAFEQELLERYLRLLEVYNEGKDNAIYPPELMTAPQLQDERMQKRVDIIKDDIASLKKAQSAALN